MADSLAKIAAKTARFQGLATRLIGNNRTVATLRQVSVGGDPWNPTLSTSDIEIAVVQDKAKQSDRNGTLVGQDVRKYIVSPSAGVAPSKADKVAVGVAPSAVNANTLFFEVVDIEPIPLGAEDVAFLIWVAA